MDDAVARQLTATAESATRSLRWALLGVAVVVTAVFVAAAMRTHFWWLAVLVGELALGYARSRPLLTFDHDRPARFAAAREALRQSL